MGKRIIILFLILTVLFITGCNKEKTLNETPNENAIPFLTFAVNERNHNVEAYLNYWDIEKGEIIQIDKVIYKVNKAPFYADGKPVWEGIVRSFAYPLSWDGENYIYLSSQYHEVKNPLNFKIRMFDDVRGKEPRKGVMCDTACSYAKDLQVYLKIRNYLKADYTAFIFTVFDGEKVRKKEVKISLYNDTFHGGIPAGQAYLYDKDKEEVKSLHLYFDNVGMGHFLVCSVNIEKGTYQWYEVTGIKGCIPFMSQMGISTIGNNFYADECGGYIGFIDMDNYSYKTFLSHDEIQKILSPYFSTIPSYFFYTLRDGGEYKDFLILSAYLDFGEEPPSNNFKRLFVAINTKTKECVGTLEWDSLHPEVFAVRDKNGKELSKIATDKLVKDISKVQDANERIYTYGGFIDEGFIRFPHKNGD